MQIFLQQVVCSINHHRWWNFGTADEIHNGGSLKFTLECLVETWVRRVVKENIHYKISSQLLLERNWSGNVYLVLTLNILWSLNHTKVLITKPSHFSAPSDFPGHSVTFNAFVSKLFHLRKCIYLLFVLMASDFCTAALFRDNDCTLLCSSNSQYILPPMHESSCSKTNPNTLVPTQANPYYTSEKGRAT